MAELARLSLTEEELDLYTVQLGAVLDHIADLEAVNTDGVPPTARPLH
ncbi:MAG: Asp-tRNA(Asn)/Glu-tRNA(Gln) amidotransferase subunit GatC, partial [Acidimicrobiales bacterium]